MRQCLFFFFFSQGEKSNGNLSSEVVEEKQANGYAALQVKEVYVAGVKIFYGSQTGTARVCYCFFSTCLKLIEIFPRFKYITCLRNAVPCKNLKAYWKVHYFIRNQCTT